MIRIAVFGVNFDNKGAEAMMISLNQFLKNITRENLNY